MINNRTLNNNMIFKYKEVIGKSFFIIGILILLYMIFSPLTSTFIHPDEFFTLGMIKFSFSDILTATAVDTHPPGHYYILKMFISILDLFHVNYNTLFVAKMVSILPYALILFVSFTKLRKEYGWFTSGTFVFAIGLMSGFFIQFLTVRMYSWGLFFLLMSFIYYKDILNNSNTKSWILFSLFSALVLFTQYYIGFSLALIYLSLFVYLFCFRQDNFKDECKKFIGSILLTILFYLPWIPKFIEQMSKKRGSHGLPPIDVNSVVHSCTYFLTGDKFIIIEILAIIFTIFLIILAFKKYDFEPTAENYYVVSGFFIFFGTIFITIIVSLIYEPILLDRYIIPVASIMWLSISILISKINSNNLLVISLTFLLIFGVVGFYDINTQSSTLCEWGTNCQNMFDDINNDYNAILVYNGGVGVLDFGAYLDNIKTYTPPVPTVYGVNNTTAHELWNYEEKTPDELESIINNNGTKIYYVAAWGNFETNNTNLKEIGEIASAKFYYVDK